jgi:hypothetical protein
MEQGLVHDLLPLAVFCDDAALPLAFLADVFSVCGDPDTTIEFQPFLVSVDGDGCVS